MIGFLAGKLISVDEHTILLDVKGVGYEVQFGNARPVFGPDMGKLVQVWIYTHVREDQISLFGFKERVQKKIFTILLGITGIGPKLAMGVVSELGVGELIEAVSYANVKTLTTVSGVGKKMAERMILELKDKLSAFVKESEWAATADQADAAVWRDLMEALSGLGFPDQKVRNVITLLRKDLQGQVPEINELLKLALQKIRNC